MKRLILTIFLITGCHTRESIEYRCPNDGEACEEKVPGVRRYEHGCTPGSSSQYWVPCNRVKSTEDRALCRKAGY